ncbi:unnamed protein product [Umbelopsis ramanniana]
MKLTAAITLCVLANTVYGITDQLSYHTSLPGVTDWYNEVNVLIGGGPVSSHFITNGFTGGYFGLQYNTTAKTGKTVQFSVSDADDGTKTTQQYCGKLSRCSTFGGEGTGLHASYDFQWSHGVNYAVIVHARPINNGYTEISGYFRPSETEWYHLATFTRKTNSPYLTGLYSSVENPNSVVKNQVRQASFGNQWVRNPANRVEELKVADFHTSALAPGDRYGAGAKGTSFYLFINGARLDIPSNNTITRMASHFKPDFDMDRYVEY